MMRQRAVVLVAFFAVWLLAASVAFAQLETPEATESPIANLVYDTPVVGRIDGSQPTQAWPFELETADRITVIVERVSGNLIPNVRVLDSSGTEQANGYGADATASMAIIDGFRLPAAGQFSVEVTRDGGESGLTAGQYRLTIIADAGAPDSPANSEPIGPIAAGTPVMGDLTPLNWSQRYTLSATATDTINIAAQRTSGTLAPQIDVFDSTGNILITGYTENTGDSAYIKNYTRPSAGDYTIAVSRQSGFDGVTAGEYVLTISLVGAGIDPSVLPQPAGTITYDTPLDGAITPEQWYQDWTLSADAGDNLTITAQRNDDATGGNLEPEVVLLGGSGQEIQRAYVASAGNVASLDDLMLTGPGVYTVRVTRAGGQTGLTTGGYTLNVALVGSGAGSPNLEGETGEITLNTPVEGTVTNARWADAWLYAGKASQQIHIEVQRTGGTLIPRLELRDANGQPIYSSYPEATRDRSSLDYTLPGTGNYQIVVIRDGDQGGATSGDYELTISEAK
jgi:hypothetical protein